MLLRNAACASDMWQGTPDQTVNDFKQIASLRLLRLKKCILRIYYRIGRLRPVLNSVRNHVGQECPTNFIRPGKALLAYRKTTECHDRDIIVLISPIRMSSNI